VNIFLIFFDKFPKNIPYFVENDNLILCNVSIFFQLSFRHSRPNYLWKKEPFPDKIKNIEKKP